MYANYDYTTFGETYASGTSETVKQRYTYTGRESTSDNDLMYYRYRMYSGNLGRFTARDPIGYKLNRLDNIQDNYKKIAAIKNRFKEIDLVPIDGDNLTYIHKVRVELYRQLQMFVASYVNSSKYRTTSNLYMYVNGNSVNATDPSGLDEEIKEFVKKYVKAAKKAAKGKSSDCFCLDSVTMYICQCMVNNKTSKKKMAECVCAISPESKADCMKRLGAN